MNMNITIGNKIKDLRRSRKLTKEVLGEALGVSFQAVSKWENIPEITWIMDQIEAQGIAQTILIASIL